MTRKKHIKCYEATIVGVTESEITFRPGFNSNQMTVKRSNLVPTPKTSPKVGDSVEVHIFKKSGRISVILDSLEIESLSKEEINDILEKVK